MIAPGVDGGRRRSKQAGPGRPRGSFSQPHRDFCSQSGLWGLHAKQSLEEGRGLALEKVALRSSGTPRRD